MIINCIRQNKSELKIYILYKTTNKKISINENEETKRTNGKMILIKNNAKKLRNKKQN